MKRQDGVLSLEAVLVLPVLALLVVGLVHTAGLLRDVLLVHEAARVGVRVAATTTGTVPVADAARRAVPEMSIDVVVSPTVRRDGDLAVVTVTASRTIGPVAHTVRAAAHALVEPAVGTDPPASPSW